MKKERMRKNDESMDKAMNAIITKINMHVLVF